MSAEVKSYLYDAIKKESGLVKNLTAKISTLDENLSASEASIDKVNDKITNLWASILRVPRRVGNKEDR